jgi:hypothetical protein
MLNPIRAESRVATLAMAGTIYEDGADGTAANLDSQVSHTGRFWLCPDEFKRDLIW